MSPTIIELCAASPVGDKQPPATEIKIHYQLPEFESMDNADSFFNSQAIILANALTDSLPGGTLDRLTAELLRRCASVLHVARGEFNSTAVSDGGNGRKEKK